MRTIETVQHAHFINNQYKSMNEIDIKTAEATAKMVNAGKILSGLLIYLTSPKPRVEGAVASQKPPKAEDEKPRPTVRPLAILEQPMAGSSGNGVEGLGPPLEHKRLVPQTEKDVTGESLAGKPVLEEKSTLNSTSAGQKTMSDKTATANGSTREEAEPKKKHQIRKQALNEQSKSKDNFAVSAYPTQRPPRQKRVKKRVATKESPPEERLVPEISDLEQLPAIEPATQEALDNVDQEGVRPEPQFVSEKASRDNCSSESLSGEDEESETSVAEEEPNSRLIAAEVASSSCDNVQGEHLTTNAADKPTTLSSQTSSMERYGSGVQGLLWAYTFSTEIDENLDDAGVWLWRNPNTYFCAQSLPQTERAGYPVLAPVVVSHVRIGGDEPIIEFDGETVYIVPHEQSWDDVRSHVSHPDFLVPRKLVEYQACEAAGYHVWRHDRDLLNCRKPGCDALTSDYHHSTVICLGCGPKSIVRYCSLLHQLEDIRGHWEECGTSRLLLKRVIDHSTAPSKFARMYPAINQRYGFNTAALHRQKLFCALTNGHYTLFKSGSTSFETLDWPKQDPRWPEMDRRVERLLNIAFLDSSNHYVLGYLYRLLRELLRSRGEWFASTERSLKYQFESEFHGHKVNPYWINGDAPCQCEWSGKIVPRWDHLTTCWAYATAADDVSLVWRRRCIEATVIDYEDRFWILRAWRQQHPTQNNWRLRAAGHGFPDIIPNEGCYKLGPGWTGWGGEEDNVWEDQRDQRNRGGGSVRSG